MSRESTAGSLRALIRARRSRIVEAWEAAVRELPVAGDLPGPVLRDEMPFVVDTIADLVGGPMPAEGRSPDHMPERHAIQRLGIGFELAHLLMEYSVLRNSILESIADAINLDVDTLLRLNRAVDTVASRSIQRFSEASERLLKTLDRLAWEALQSKGVDELLERLLAVLMQASPSVDSVAILLVQDDGRLHMRAASGLIAERDPSFSLAVGEGFSGTIAATRTPLLSRHAAADPRVKSDFFRMRGVRALYGVPLHDVEVIGVAHMGSLTVSDFTNEEKLLFQAMATRATGAIIQAQLMDRERMARRRAEEEHTLLATTVRQMPVGILICDAASHRVLVSNAGASPEQWGPGALPRDVFDRGGARLRADQLPLARALAGEEVIAEEVRVRGATGDWATLEASAVPVRDPDGGVVAAVLILDEVSERRLIEEERELYLSTVSHDLRSPLTVLRLSAASVLKKADDESTRNTARRMLKTIEGMNRLLEQLLDFARSRHAGGIPITRQATDLGAVCRDIVDNFSVVYPDRRVELDGTAVGEWDPDRLRQLVQNLIGNALEHGRADAPVLVTLRQDAEEVFLRVRNSNAGGPIPAALQSHIFDPFRRGSERGGLGLGLYICRQIVMAHGGRIDLETDHSDTTFVVRLPLQPHQDC